MIHHPTLTVTASIEADTPEVALEFLRQRVETAGRELAKVWGTDQRGYPLFEVT